MTPKFLLLNVAACAALTVSAATDASTHRQAPDPVANPSAVVRQGNARFTVLTPEMIRVEYSPSGKDVYKRQGQSPPITVTPRCHGKN